MKKYRFILLVLLVILAGCSKFIDKTVKLTDEQLYQLLTEMTTKEKLFDPLTKQPGYYVFDATKSGYEITILNDDKQVKMELVRGDVQRSTLAIQESALFIFDVDGRHQEGRLGILTKPESVNVTFDSYLYGYLSLQYSNGVFSLNREHSFTSIQSIQDLPDSVIEDLAHKIEEIQKYSESYQKSAYHAFDVLSEMILAKDQAFQFGQESSYVTSVEEHRRMNEQMQTMNQTQCTEAIPTESEKQILAAVKALAIDTEDFKNPNEATMNEQMASNILGMSELYDRYGTDFYSTYTQQKADDFQLPSTFERVYEKYQIGFIDRYEVLQQQLFPGSIPYPLTNKVVMNGRAKLHFYPKEGFVMFEADDGDSPDSFQDQAFIADYKQQSGLVTAKIVYYDQIRGFIVDQDGNSYASSSCLETGRSVKDILTQHPDRFLKKEIKFRDRGKRYLEIIFLRTI